MNTGIKLISGVIIFGFIFATSAWPQQSAIHTHEDRNYKKGMELLEKENYGAAQVLFRKAYDSYGSQNSVLKTNTQYYIALCAVRLFNGDAEYLTLSFVKDNPESPLVNPAYFNLAGYFYDVQKYKNAISYYKKVDKGQLKDEEQAECYFKTGYSYFKIDDPDNARVAFNEIKDKNTRFSVPAIYYYSHINYSQGNYQTALDGFLKLSDDETFSPIVPYYVTQIYFLQKKYEKVVEYAPRVLDYVTESRHAEVARMTGVSFYMLKRFDESIPYLLYYIEHSGDVTPEDKYQLAFAYYKAGEYDKAAKMFGSLSNENSLLCQNALYHLADCYLKLGKKHEARMAFASASKLDYDPQIKEDALFNYALVTYELSYSPFNEAIQALNDYIKLYPGSKRTDEAYNYLGLAYLNARNYSMALSSIDKIKDKNEDIRKAYQKIAYYRALELFNNLKFSEAVELFNNSTKYGSYSNKLYALTYYWRGEAYYRLGEYDKAIGDYKKYVDMPVAYGQKEFNTAHYNLGYAYFKKKDYSEASVWFRKYTGYAKDDKSRRYGDALNRTGDCFFIRKDFYSAIDFYDRSIKAGITDVDYAMFQKGLSLGVLNRYDEKVQCLNELLKVYPGSAYTDDALFEIGESYMSRQKHDLATPYFQKIVNTFPNSSYVSKALVKLGLIYYSADNNEESLRLYKRVVSDYPGTAEAQSALKGIKNIYVDMNNIDAYFAYVNNLGDFARVDMKEQDSLTYITAEKLYLSGDCERSSQGFSNYIKKYKDGSFILDAHFYKGDCNYQLKQYDEAMESFDYIIGRPRNIYTEQALLGASRIKFRLKDYGSAIGYYKKLEEVTELNSNKLEARIGLMRCYYYLDNFSEAVDAAKSVLATEKISAAMEREARFILAKSLYATDRAMLALEQFGKIASEVNSEEGAESKFRMAEIYFSKGDLENAEKEIFDFTEKTTPHQYWMAKSFILWSDIFAARGDYFQATQTLQSIIDYYEVTDDGIIALAKEKLEKLVKEQQSVEKKSEQQDMEVNMKEK
jgi:TolA-binding protein